MVAAPATLSRFLCRRGFTYEESQMAAEYARADLRGERPVWAGQRQPRMRKQPYRLVFLDDTDVNTRAQSPCVESAGLIQRSWFVTGRESTHASSFVPRSP